VFPEVAEEFIDFIKGAELIIHNAPFDVGFIDAELAKLEGASTRLSEICAVIDTLQMARHKHPGQRNNLDALCQRYEIDNTSRALHGALLDAEILAEVYLAMTGGQASLGLSAEAGDNASTDGGPESTAGIRRLPNNRKPLPVISASREECQRHEDRLTELDSVAGEALWRVHGP